MPVLPPNAPVRVSVADRFFPPICLMFNLISRAPAAFANALRGGAARGGRSPRGPGRTPGANFNEGRRSYAPSHARGARRTARGSVGAFARGGVPYFIMIRETSRKIKFCRDEVAPAGLACHALRRRAGVFSAQRTRHGGALRWSISRDTVHSVRRRRKIGRLASEAARRTT